MTRPRNLATVLLDRHSLASGGTPDEIGLLADQALLTDVLGTLVILELLAMGADRVSIGIAAQYVDHNLLEVDHLNAEEHLFLHSACRKLGIWYARAGTGISHPVHLDHFGRPGAMLVGCDSHSCGAGALGMLAIGMGGIDVALAMMRQPVFVPKPRIWGIRLENSLPPFVSAKDVILEMLRRYGVDGGHGRIIEYHGPGVATLTVMDRQVIANMGAELGATTSIFPSDLQTLAYLEGVGRKQDWRLLEAEAGAAYDDAATIDLAAVEPLVALPGSPANVVPVRTVAPTRIYQSYIGSSAAPGFRDIAVAARMLDGARVAEHVSLDINPSTRRVLHALAASGDMARLLDAGARFHQPGCNGCIGMGQAPAKGRPSLRTVPRNFPGRSGTVEDSVYLCSPETAAASALHGSLIDPRDAGLNWSAIPDRAEPDGFKQQLIPPLEEGEAQGARILRPSNVTDLPELPPLPVDLRMPIILKVGDDVSTDAILPAGNEVMPHWTNLPRASRFMFRDIDATYPERAAALARAGKQHGIVAGANYGQGSSRENAALIPRSNGLGLVLAREFARIHWQNLVNFGVLPLTFGPGAATVMMAFEGEILIEDVAARLRRSTEIDVVLQPSGTLVRCRHTLSERQIALLAAGGAINRYRLLGKHAAS